MEPFPYRTGNLTDPFESELYSVLQRGGLEYVRVAAAETADQETDGTLGPAQTLAIAQEAYSFLEHLWLNTGCMSAAIISGYCTDLGATLPISPLRKLLYEAAIAFCGHHQSDPGRLGAARTKELTGREPLTESDELKKHSASYRLDSALPAGNESVAESTTTHHAGGHATAMQVRQPKRRTGFEPAMDLHRRIVATVERHAPKWRTSHQWRDVVTLKRICADLDKDEIEVPERWRKGETEALDRAPTNKWVEALDIAKTGKKLVADQIRTSIKAVRKQDLN
jgi:hypothetical protein